MFHPSNCKLFQILRIIFYFTLFILINVSKCEIINENSFNDQEPLILTPYIEKNKTEEGRNLSQVRGLSVNVTSYSGFLTVNKTYNSNLFFWFFPSCSNKSDVPVVLWLQGGPGGSSMFGLFVENGPIKVLRNGSLSTRFYSWTKDFALLYIDNPVGTGFSFTKNDAGYSKTEEDVAGNLYNALKQFFTLFSEYKGNPFFLAGESYAGKYLPALGYTIHQKKNEQHGINLRAFLIGDGYCDPKNMLNYGDYLYQLGFIGEKQLEHFKGEQKKAGDYIDQGKMKEAADVFQNLILGDEKQLTYFYNVTGLKFYYNIMYDHGSDAFNYYLKFLNQTDTKKLIHVGNLTFGDLSLKVEEALVEDLMKSVKPYIEKLLNAGYRMLFYNGQFDIIVAPPLTENFLLNLNWKGSDQYKNATRRIYKVNRNDREVAGYVRVAQNLYQAVIRKGGHILPFDQPRVVYDLVKKFIKDENLFK